MKAIFSLSGEERRAGVYLRTVRGRGQGLSPPRCLFRHGPGLLLPPRPAAASSFVPTAGLGSQGSQRGVLPGGSLGEPAVCRGLAWMHGTGRQGDSTPRAVCVCLLTPVSSGPRAGIGTWQVSCLSDRWRGGRGTGRNRGFE